jgi:hypothetical protein
VFFIDGLAPVERKNESESGWAAFAEYRLADEGICTLLPDDLDFRYAIAGECSVGMAHCAQEFMEVRAGDRVLLVGNGQRQFSLSHVITGLFRGAKVISAVQDDFQAERVKAIGEARGGTPDLPILDMRDPSWTEEVFELTDGIGCDANLSREKGGFGNGISESESRSALPVWQRTDLSGMSWLGAPQARSPGAWQSRWPATAASASNSTAALSVFNANGFV